LIDAGVGKDGDRAIIDRRDEWRVEDYA